MYRKRPLFRRLLLKRYDIKATLLFIENIKYLIGCYCIPSFDQCVFYLISLMYAALFLKKINNYLINK